MQSDVSDRTVSLVSKFSALPDVLTSSVFVLLDFADHLRLAYCSRTCRAVSLMRESSCPNMTLVLSRTCVPSDCANGRFRARPASLCVSNPACQQCLATILSGTAQSLRRLRIASDVPVRVSCFANLARLSALEFAGDFTRRDLTLHLPSLTALTCTRVLRAPFFENRAMCARLAHLDAPLEWCNIQSNSTFVHFAALTSLAYSTDNTKGGELALLDAVMSTLPALERLCIRRMQIR
jgi:hypothetical protein